MLKKNSLLFFVTVIALAGIAVAYKKFSPEKTTLASAKEYTVELREDGFFPAEIIIADGDTVTFKTTGKKDFWPAGDPHPTHDYLSGFDPGHPIGVQEKWSYTFTEPGTWRYHDHLAVSFHGQVTVLNKEGNKLAQQSKSGEYCDGQCFDDLIRKTVEKEGIDAAYALFQKTFAQGNLPRTCHWTAHQIGEAAYGLYKKGVNFPISYATSYCGFGFYHGFMEGLLRENPDSKRALDFCKKVEEQLGNMGLQNCYHGIGHGYTEDPPDPATRGNFDAMLKPGIKMCEFLFGKNFRDLNLCLTGVFTVPAGFAAKGEFGLAIDPRDPFSYCLNQPYRYKKACYGEFAPKMDVKEILNRDIHRLPKYVDAISDDKLQRLVIWVVPSVMLGRDILSNDFSSYINGCRESFSGRSRLICWGGTILGFFAHGEPEKQYLKVLEFCKSPSFKEDELDFCYGEGFRQMRRNYSMDKVRQICETAPEKYRHYCLDKENLHQSPYDDPSFD